MKITIKHNIKREGCTLSGQILDCQFLDGAERDDRVYYYDKNEKRHLISCGYSPELWGNTLFVWAKGKDRDLNMLSYTYPTEQAAQDMLDFINTFVEKEGTVQSEPKEKRYKLIESEDGKTLDEMAEIMTAGTDNIPKRMSDTIVKNGVHSITVKMETIFVYGLKALLGGEEWK